MGGLDMFMPGGGGSSFGGDWASGFTAGPPEDSQMSSGGDYASGFAPGEDSPGSNFAPTSGGTGGFGP